MRSINILPVGFSKKAINKWQKSLGNSFFILPPENRIHQKNHLILINGKADDICKKITGLMYFQNENLPVILFTPLDEKFILRCFQNGITDFIVENMPVELIKAKLKAWVQYQKKLYASKKKIKIGSLIIHPKKRKVSRKNKEVDLTKIEFDILNLLVADRNKIYSRDEIYEYIWGRDVIVGERTLDVHMNNLRKKIGKNKILTKKGIGFGINPDL